MKRLFSISYDSSVLNLWLLLLRIGVAAAMLTHGWPKLMKVLGGDFQFMDPIGLGAAPSLLLVTFSEAICSFLILFGLATRLATITLIISCSVAALVAHANDPYAKKEVLVLYILIYITLLVLGGGRYSADAAIVQNRRGY